MQPFRTSLRTSLILSATLLLAACGALGGSRAPATSISVSTAFLAFDGSSSASITVSANGEWTLEPNVAWLKATPASGREGRTDVTVTVDRSGLAPVQHAGNLVFTGAAQLSTVTVSMRFPTVSGRLVEPSGRLAAASLAESGHAGSEGASAVAGGGPEAIPGEYLVMLNGGMLRLLEAASSGVELQAARPSEGTLRAMAAGVAADHGVAVASQAVSPDFPLMLVNADPAAAARLAADGRVRLVEPNRRWVVPDLEVAPTAEHDFGWQWHYDSINLADAWSITDGEESVVVAVIDTGFATAHPDFAGSLLDGYDFANGDPDPSSYSVCAAHGTHVAGTVAASRNLGEGTSGAAPGVRLRLVRAGNPEPEGCGLSTLAVVNGIRYAAGYQVAGAPRIAPVDVINLSLGGNGNMPILEEAVRSALAAGVSVVAAAGNDGTDHSVYAPAAYDGVIGVAATDYNDQRAPYSNAGSEIDVAAPGGNGHQTTSGGRPASVLSLGWDLEENEANYVWMDGTSMAAPHVAAVVALMKSVEPSLKPAEIVFLLRASARDLGAVGPDDDYGWGMVDAAAAMRLATEASWAKLSDVTVRLRDGDVIVASAQADTGGGFDLGQVAPGSYLLEAGTGRADAAIGDFGAFYGGIEVSVNASDVNVSLELELFGDAR